MTVQVCYHSRSGHEHAKDADLKAAADFAEEQLALI